MRTSQATTNCNTRIKHSHSCVGSPLKTDIFETSKRSPLSWGQSHMLGEELHQCNEKTLEQGLPGCVSWRWSSSTEEDEVAAQTPSSSQLEWSSKSASVVRERLNHIAFTAKCSQKYVRNLRKYPFSAGNSISAHLSCLHKRWWSLFGEDRSENGRTSFATGQIIFVVRTSCDVILTLLLDNSNCSLANHERAQKKWNWAMETLSVLCTTILRNSNPYR